MKSSVSEPGILASAARTSSRLTASSASPAQAARHSASSHGSGGASSETVTLTSCCSRKSSGSRGRARPFRRRLEDFWSLVRFSLPPSYRILARPGECKNIVLGTSASRCRVNAHITLCKALPLFRSLPLFGGG